MNAEGPNPPEGEETPSDGVRGNSVSAGSTSTTTPAAEGYTRLRLPLAPTTIAWFAALIGWTCLLCFYHLDGGARFEPTDCWVSQTAREMSEGTTWRDFVVPVFSTETRMQKSPGPYWAVMLTSLLRDTPVDEAAARIPNGIAALLMVATIFWLTRRVAGDRAAIFAGFAASSSVLILYWSHRGASDLGLAAFTTISLATLWVAANDEPRGRKQTVLFMIGYLAAGFGMLYKLPMPLAVIGAPVFFYLLLRNRWRILWDKRHLLGLLLFLLPWLPWAIAVCIAEPVALAKWRVEFVDRFTGKLPNVEGQQEDWRMYFIYLVPMVVYCIPYSLSLPQALARGFRKQVGVNRDGMIFMLIWFFSLLAFFTASAGKEYRYFLPAIPPLFVLLGVELSAFFDPQRARAPRLLRAGTWLACLLVPAGFVGGAFGMRKWYELRGVSMGFEWAQVWQPYLVAALIFCIGAIISAILYHRRRGNASFATLAATMYALWLWAWPSLMPVVVSEAPFREFAAQLRNRIPPEYVADMRQIAQQDSRVIWYSNYRFPRIIDQLELLQEQDYRRNLEYERRRIGEEMITQLSGDKRVLFVIELFTYAEFLVRAPVELANDEGGRKMPPHYLWLRTRLGREDHQCVLISNKPPSWEPLAFEVPSNWRRAILERAGHPEAEFDRLPAPARPLTVSPPSKTPISTQVSDD